MVGVVVGMEKVESVILVLGVFMEYIWGCSDVPAGLLVSFISLFFFK